jgi:hypothetical protein
MTQKLDGMEAPPFIDGKTQNGKLKKGEQMRHKEYVEDFLIYYYDDDV